MRYLLVTIFIYTLLACNPVKNPEFREVRNVKIVNASMENIDIEAEILMFNPNGFKMHAAKAEIIAFFDEKKVAEINQIIDEEMPANGNFTFPIRISVSPKDIFDGDVFAAMAAAMQLISKRQLGVKFNGKISVGKRGFHFDVPIDYQEDVKF